MRARRTVIFSSLLIAAGVMLPATMASAHTETDLVAVAAGSEATISLKPTHGCDGSPTVEVAIQAPVAGAVAGEVDGWTATSTAKGDKTVLEWKGGSLPDDAHGKFPVTFTVPDTVGELMLFPSVQVCENGEELNWISGNPEADNPAPRLLVLAAGSKSAASIDEVPADAAGRDLLTAVVDTDQSTTTEPPATTEAPANQSSTTGATGTSGTSKDDVTAQASAKDDAQDEDDGSPWVVIVIAVVLLAGAATGAGLWIKQRGK